MKTSARISPPVLFLTALAGLAIFIGLWVARPRRDQPPPVAEAQTISEATSVASDQVPESATPPAAVPLREGDLPPVIPISLKPVITTVENDQWDKSAVFLAMPRGTQSLGGIEFWLEGTIQLQSKSSKDEKRTYREKIVVPLALTNWVGGKAEKVPRGKSIGAVHLLGATRYGGEGECTVANLVWRYADGSVRRSPIQFDNHVRDWIRLPYEAPMYLPYAFSKVVWSGVGTNQPGRKIRLYRFSYANPEPAKEIRQLEFVSGMEIPNLFLVGLTLDPLRLGERPDDSPNQEPMDATPARQIEVRVVTAQDQPIPGARVRVMIQRPGGLGSGRIDRTTTTDSFGAARLNYPPAPELDRLEVGASHDDHGARKIVWDAKAGDIVPGIFTLKLSGGINIGGVIVDRSDNPIADAQLRLGRFWTGGEEMNKRGEQSDFPSRTVASDSQGRWQAKGLPADLLNRISLSVSHPDFVPARMTVGDNSSEEAKLRDGTHRIVLDQGLYVQGRVLDEKDIPISDARVWAGMPNFTGSQDAKTDAQGAFNFRNLKEGELQFSVLAKGRKPATKTVTVKNGMEEILFRLGAGQVIRGLVKNESGEPLSGVRVALEDPGGGVSQDIQFEMTTDNTGRFEWNGAPDEQRNFCFLKTGYEAKRRQPLKLNEENVVTLRKGRKVQGWVLDTTTEKPITKFRVGVGRRFDADSFFPDWPGMKDFSDPTGAFTWELGEEENTAVKAVAEDYAEQVEKFPEAQNGVVQVVLRLKPSASLRATLLTAEGAPVPGATVVIATGNRPGGGVTFRNGRFEDYGRGKVVTTDAKGEFVLSSPPETGTVLAAAETGFASASIQQVRDTARLVVQAFGKIEGTFKVAGQPVAGQEFMFSMNNAGISFDFGAYKATTDEAGRFTIGKVPAGEGQIVRLVKTSERSWSHSHSTDVVVQSGQTTQIALGDSGAVLKGSVRYETPPGDDEKLSISGQLSTKMPPMPSFQNAEESRAFFESPEWKAQMKQRKFYSVSVGNDGTLQLDSIPAGTYTLSITANKAGAQPWESRPVAQGSTEVIVAENPSPFTPISVGEIVLRPSRQSAIVPKQ